MPRLTNEHKAFIVVHLAMYFTPTETAEAVKDAFGVEIPKEQVYHYDPTRPNGPEKWLELFNEARKKFLESVSDIPIANQAVRLRRLEDAYRRARNMGSKGNVPLEASLLEKAAQEVGGKHTNRHLVSVDGELGVSGVMRVAGEQLSPRDWAGLAREQQQELGKAADAATAAALPKLKAAGGTRSGKG